MGVLECRIPISRGLAETMPRNPALVGKLAVEVEGWMRDEASKFAKSLVGVPAMVDVAEDEQSSVLLPKSAQMVTLVFQCHTT